MSNHRSLITDAEIVDPDSGTAWDVELCTTNPRARNQRAVASVTLSTDTADVVITLSYKELAKIMRAFDRRLRVDR